jgi:hypothetical protein
MTVYYNISSSDIISDDLMMTVYGRNNKSDSCADGVSVFLAIYCHEHNGMDRGPFNINCWSPQPEVAIDMWSCHICVH